MDNTFLEFIGRVLMIFGFFFILFGLLYFGSFLFTVKRIRQHRLMVLWACGMNDEELHNYEPNFSNITLR